MSQNDCIICGNIVDDPGYICSFCRKLEQKEYSREDEILEREERKEHNDYNEDDTYEER